MPPAIERAIDRMFAQQEPFPMAAITRSYDVLKANGAMTRVLGRFILDPSAMGTPPNLMRILFDLRLSRTFVVDWERSARGLLSRLHRESLAHPGDGALAALVRGLLEYPEVPESFRHPDFSDPSEPVFTLKVRRDGLELAFLTTITVFSAPQDVTLEELLLESYFPLDEVTTRACERMAADISWTPRATVASV
jgi:hypothetical protein